MATRRLLVANRGEIALRVFRTCVRLGIEPVAVITRDDRSSLHARAAGTSVEISSYLDADAHIRAARESDADAIHPGYGFLAESAAFAAEVETAGLTWIGPPAEVLRRGGDKLTAKRIAATVGVPVLPQGDAAEIGFPMVVKASAGGGGRGMRVVRSARDLDEALAASAREAEAAFGDGTVYCERYLERPRHVEVQILGTREGVYLLGQRDCSVQRRHQKLLEESPPPSLSPVVADEINRAAAAFAEAIGYRNAGTAEFLVDGGHFYFLELNGRLQVEHPVTEELLGLDLVELQIRVAEGASIFPTLAPRGHAVEVRLYAEDPVTFLPQSGRIERLVLPSGIRVDAGVEEGDEVPIAYDPMIAKLIAHGSTRDDALDRLARALAETVVEGVTTNLALLRWLVSHPAFRADEPSTAFLLEHPPLSPLPLRVAPSPWRTAWRLNLPPPPPSPPPNADAGLHTPAMPGAGDSVTAPMPGTVIDVRVAEGDVVTARQSLVVLEAMKMEVPVVAHFAGRVSAVHVVTGDTVDTGSLLVELDYLA